MAGFDLTTTDRAKDLQIGLTRGQMDTNVLNSKWLWLAIVSLAAISGCCCEAYPLPGECDCPTDARRLYLGTGEEAVRRCPCGPDREYFGLKPTCWRRWPDGWGCGRCDHPSSPEGSCGEAVGEELRGS